VLLVAGVGIAFLRYRGFSAANTISPEHFQAFNPIFVVFLTPLVLVYFAFLRKRDKEPSSPRKIGIGMGVAALAYVFMVLASQGLQSPKELETAGGVSSILCSPYWLITTYFSLTIAELFLSPMGLAFVAKVAPPKIRGMMQGGWLAATAIGNALCGVMGIPYERLPLWMTFAIMVFTSLLSFTFIFCILKKLEAATKS